MEDDDSFDTDIIIHINSVFFTLKQLGVGPIDGFHIENNKATWSDFIADPSEIHAIKTYMFMKVKLVFDSSAMTSAAITSFKESINEFEWRLNVDAETESTE